MNEHDDNFEAELRSLRPAPPSPHLKQRIAQQLYSTTRYMMVVSATAAAAVILLAATLWFTWSVDAPPQPQQLRIVESPAPDDTLAHLSAWRYHQVARQSPRDLMLLLDQQAADAPAIGGPTPTVHQLLESNS